MSVTYPELSKKFNSSAQIPNKALYDCITQPEFRKSLSDQANLGLAHFLSIRVVEEVRRRCKEDLFWLSRYFLWESNPECAGKPLKFNKVTEATHLPLTNVFVKKDATKTIEHQDDLYKERLILYPRGSFKSTIDVCDAVQWILNFPEVRILYLSSSDTQSIKFLDETKGHFVVRTIQPSLMNLFFPEYCVEEKDLTRGLNGPDRFTCPLWAAKQIIRGEPTVFASSILSKLSGLHFDVAKVDDAVETLNSESEEQCQKLIKHMGINMKMVMPYGYKDYIGTRYSDEEMYAEILRKNVGTLQVTSGLDSKFDPRPWTLTLNPDIGMKILIGTGWKLKPEAETEVLAGRVKEEDLEEKDYYILFPENLPYQKLRRMQKEDEIAFEGQINQNPRPKSTVVFDRPMLLRHTVPFRDLPVSGPVAITWDFAFSQKKGRDFTTGVVGMYNGRSQLFVVDLVRSRFNHTSLAKAIVDLADNWRPFVIGIEDVAGAKFLEPAIITEAQRRNKPELAAICGRIDWFTPDQQKDAKKQRMASLHPWLMDDRLFFAAHLPQLDALYNEFERCLHSHHHDDIPDVIAHLTRYAPRMQTMIAKNEMPIWSMEDAEYNLLYEENCDAFGRPGMGIPPPPMTPPLPDTGIGTETPNGLEPILGSGLFG